MLLLTYKEWLGLSTAGRRSCVNPSEPEVSIVAFATLLSLGDAVSLVKQHSDIYKLKYPSMAVEFSLISVSKIDSLTAEELKQADVQLVEQLPQSVEEFD